MCKMEVEVRKKEDEGGSNMNGGGPGCVLWGQAAVSTGAFFGEENSCVCPYKARKSTEEIPSRRPFQSTTNASVRRSTSGPPIQSFQDSIPGLNS
jgi:hypothetical protein